ncbi:TPA: phage tail fiber protein [Klebsiella michiganensis]
MSVPNQTPYNIYTANGLTTVFAYEFYLISASDIQVTINGSVVSSGYTVSGVGNVDGGDITFLTPPASTSVVLMERVVPTYRLTDYQDNGDLLADTVNKDFDRLWMAIQRAFIYLGVALTRPLFGGGPFNANGYRISNLADPVNDQDAATKKFIIENANVNLARTIRVPENNVAPLPAVNGRKKKIFAWDDVGNPIAVLPESGSAADVLIELASSDGAKLIGGLSFLTVEMYSYLAEGNDWRKAIQAAIDQAHQNYLAGSGPTNILIGGEFTVTLNPDSTLIPGEVAAGRGALCMRSGVTLMGGGSITLDGSFTGSSSGAIITNWEGAADNCKIQGITFNGSRGTAAGTGITCINIVDSDNVTIDNVKAFDSTSGGIYLRRANNTVYGCSNSRILNCYVHNVGYIGIQCERPNGMTITGCTVTSCGDNGIDIFGNVTDDTGQGIAENVVIANCTVGDISVGIFIESCGNATISACVIFGFPNSGIFFNRINTAAYNCSVTGCTITGKDITTSQGIRWKNAVGYTRVYNNTLKNCINSFVTTGGMIYVDIGVNNHENIGRCFLYVPKTSNGCVYTRMAQQVYNGVQTDGIPYNTTPRGWPSTNNTRYYRCSFTAPYMMYSATTGEDNFIRATGNLPSNSGWGPAYSLYNSIVAGETVIAMSSALVAGGEFMLINGNYYSVHSVTSSYAVVRKWDVTSQDYTAGDYTSYLNSAYAYSIFRKAWGTI